MSVLNRIKKSIIFANDIVRSIVYFQTVKVFLNNHLTVGLKYLKKQNTSFPHPVGIVIGMKVILGQNCTIYQNVTIGTKDTKGFQNAKYPRIGDNVTIFAGAIIFGDINIGNNVIIGPGSVVFVNIPDNSTVVGNPSRIVNKK